MRSMGRMVTLTICLVLGATFVYAGPISYTFTGADGLTGTDWTLVDPSGFIPDDTNVLGLLTTSTDFFSMGEDFGPLIGIGDAGEQSGNVTCVNAGSPCFEINMAITYMGGPYVIPFFFKGTDGTSGTFTEISSGSTLTIASVPTPEPRSVTIALFGMGLGLMMLVRRRNRIA